MFRPPQVIKTGFKAIRLIYFFTAGEDEVKCWTIRLGFKAPQAARYADTNVRCGVPSTAGAAEKARRYGCDVLPIV